MTHESFAQRVSAMEATLYHVAATLLRRPCDQEDAVQEALARAWQHRASLRDEAAFPGWLLRILINTAHGMGRKRQREIVTDALPMAAAPEQTPVYRLFSGLEEKYRLPMVLHYVEGYDVAEVAAMLHRPVNTVKSQLMRGRARLRALLEEEGL